MRFSLLTIVAVSLIALTSCEKQDDILIDDMNVETVVDVTIDNTFPNLQSSSSKISTSTISQAELIMQYEQALVALDYLQSQNDFFTNGSINSAIKYIEARLDLLNKTNTFTADAIVTFAENLVYIAGVVENNIKLFRATHLGGNVDTIIEAMEKQADEAPFRMFETVPTNMNGVVVTLEGIEWIKVEGGFQFVVLGDNVDLLPEAKHTLYFEIDGASNTGKVEGDFININASNFDVLEVTTTFVGAVETFILK